MKEILNHKNQKHGRPPHSQFFFCCCCIYQIYLLRSSRALGGFEGGEFVFVLSVFNLIFHFWRLHRLNYFQLYCHPRPQRMPTRA